MHCINLLLSWVLHFGKIHRSTNCKRKRSQNSCVAIVCSSTSSFAIKNIRFDFNDELKIGDVRYKHLT